jgi:hypothetical protein
VELPCGVGGVELSPVEPVPASPTSLPDPAPLPDPEVLPEPELPPEELPLPEVPSPEELPLPWSPDADDPELSPEPSVLDEEPQLMVAMPVMAQAATNRHERSHRSRDMARPFRARAVNDASPRANDPRSGSRARPKMPVVIIG